LRHCPPQMSGCTCMRDRFARNDIQRTAVARSGATKQSPSPKTRDRICAIGCSYAGTAGHPEFSRPPHQLYHSGAPHLKQTAFVIEELDLFVTILTIAFAGGYYRTDSLCRTIRQTHPPVNRTLLLARAIFDSTRKQCSLISAKPIGSHCTTQQEGLLCCPKE
jgi:hypothetical protein